MTKDERTIVAWFYTRKCFSDNFFSPKRNLTGKMNPNFSPVFVFESYLSHMTGRILTYG